LTQTIYKTFHPRGNSKASEQIYLPDDVNTILNLNHNDHDLIDNIEQQDLADFTANRFCDVQMKQLTQADIPITIPGDKEVQIFAVHKVFL
jgi:hypothetical protein